MRLTEMIWVPLALAAMAATPFLAQADEEEAPGGVEVVEVGEQVVDQEAMSALPEGHFVAAAEALDVLWDELDLAGDSLPEVDFAESILVIEYRDAADPNTVRYGVTVNAEGELEIDGMSTMMGFDPSDQVRLTFLAVPREGVTALVRIEQNVDDDGTVTFDRVVYPLDGDAE